MYCCTPQDNSIRNSAKNGNKEKIELRPPPIVVSSVHNFQEFHSYLSRKINNKFLIKLLAKGSYKINTFHIDNYRNITKLLNSEKIDWYSVENKTRIIICGRRGLVSSVSAY